MDEEIRQKIVKSMKYVAEDAKNDVKEFDGKPFNGKTVAQYFGCQGAQIKALANAIIRILEEDHG